MNRPKIFRLFVLTLVVSAVFAGISMAAANRINYAYYANATATDQGAASATADRTIKDIVDTAGSDSATIVLAHTGTGSTTTYTVGTDETIPSNVMVRIEKGAILSVSSGKTLTIYSPANIIAQPGQQIFTGSGTVTFTVGGTIPAEWYPGDTISQKIQAVVDAHDGNYSLPLDIVLTASGSTGRAWGTTVQVDRDGNFTLRGDGEVVVYASAAIDRFLDLGIERKLNYSRISGISFDAYDQTVTDGIRVAAASRLTCEMLNFKVTSGAGGSFTYGIKLDPSVHTGVDGSSGFVLSRFADIYPGGNGAVTGATIYCTGGQTNVVFDNIRAVDGCNAIKAYCAASTSFSSNTIMNISGDSGSSDALIDLDTGAGDSIAENVFIGINGEGKYGIAFKARGATATVRDNIVTGLKEQDWDTQALYCEDSSNTEAYRGTYIYRNFWNQGPSLDSGSPIAVQDYQAAAWGVYSGSDIAAWQGDETEGLEIWDAYNGTTWQRQNQAWEADVIKIRLNTADDTAYRIPIPTRIQTGFFAQIAGKSTDDKYMAIIAGRAETSAHCTSVHSGADIALTTGALTGTDGTDAKLNISTHTDGYLYIENRVGGTLIINISISQ